MFLYNGDVAFVESIETRDSSSKVLSKIAICTIPCNTYTLCLENAVTLLRFVPSMQMTVTDRDLNRLVKRDVLTDDLSCAILL